MQVQLVDALRERQADLLRERGALALEFTGLQTRQATVAAELTRIGGLLEFYEGPSQDPDGIPTTALPRSTASDAAPTASTIAVPSSPDLDQTRMANTATSAAPPEGAWKAEAIRLLEEQGGPMHYKDLYRALAMHGFAFGGRNPEAVLLTGVSREKDTFQAIGKGCYWIAGRPLPQGAKLEPAHTTARKRRPRPIGRARGRGA
jgi:hypothetical protein